MFRHRNRIHLTLVAAAAVAVCISGCFRGHLADQIATLRDPLAMDFEKRLAMRELRDAGPLCSEAESTVAGILENPNPFLRKDAATTLRDGAGPGASYALTLARDAEIDPTVRAEIEAALETVESKIDTIPETIAKAQTAEDAALQASTDVSNVYVAPPAPPVALPSDRETPVTTSVTIENVSLPQAPAATVTQAPLWAISPPNAKPEPAIPVAPPDAIETASLPNPSNGTAPVAILPPILPPATEPEEEAAIVLPPPVETPSAPRLVAGAAKIAIQPETPPEIAPLAERPPDAPPALHETVSVVPPSAEAPRVRVTAPALPVSRPPKNEAPTMTPAPAPAAPVVTAKIPAHAVDIAKIDLSAVPPKPEERPEVEAPFVAPPPIEPPSVPNLPVGIDAIDLAPPTPVVVEAPVNETAPLTEEPNIAPIPVETPAPIAAAPTPRPFGSMPEIERRPIELMGRETLEEHITSLEAPEPNRRLIAAMALRLRGGPEHIEPLRAAFQRERDAAAKVEMRRALVALGGSPNPPPAPQISAPVVKLPPEDPRPATVLGPESPASTFNPATPLIKIPDPVATPKTSSPKIKATPKAGPTPEAPAIQVDAAPPKPIETR